MTNIKLKIFIAITILVLAGGAAFWLLFFRDTKTFKSLNFKSLNTEIFKSLNDESAVYQNSKYSFSFSHPKELNISEFTEGNRDIILIKNEKGDGFQISIMPFDETGPITKERILKDIPNLDISNDKLITLGGESALSFKSKDESGETFEIWFVRGGNLYQISALASFGDTLEAIITTWTFQ